MTAARDFYENKAKMIAMAIILAYFLQSFMPNPGAWCQQITNPTQELQNEMAEWIQLVHERTESYNYSIADHKSMSFGPGQRDNTMSVDLGASKMKPKIIEGTTVILVDKLGRGAHKTVQAAVDAVPDHNDKKVIILVKPGVYRERVRISKHKAYITLIGSGRLKTKITYNVNAAKAGTTYKSATFAALGDYFTAYNITFENTAPAPKPGDAGRQAAAFLIEGDKGALYSCGFIGYQDTLYDKGGKHFFYKCYIQGSIDFIFGDGQSYYKDCHMHSVATTFGAITAQKRSSNKDAGGFSFVDCKITGTGRVYLSRAWGSYSRVVFSRTYIGVDVTSPQYSDWGDEDRRATVFYGQYDCSGPGARVDKKEKWYHEFTREEVAPFLTVSFIDGKHWLKPLIHHHSSSIVNGMQTSKFS